MKTALKILNNEFITNTEMNAEHGNLNPLQLRIVLKAMEEYRNQSAPPPVTDKPFLNKLVDIIVRYRNQTGETGVGNHIQNEINEYLATKSK